MSGPLGGAGDFFDSHCRLIELSSSGIRISSICLAVVMCAGVYCDLC